MTERTLQQQPEAPPAVEEPTLADLRAHRKLHKDSEQRTIAQVVEPVTDLSSASITSIPVHRVTTKRERRDTAQLIRARTPAVTNVSTDRTSQERFSRSKAQSPGIFNNPHFRYEGGPLARVITFLANVLKFLERLLLSGLGAFRAPQQPAKIITPNAQTPNSTTQRSAKKSGTRASTGRLRAPHER